MNQKEDLQAILAQQQSEANDHAVYLALSLVSGDAANRGVLEKIAAEEQSHYTFLHGVTGVELSANRWIVWIYVWMARLMGVSFALRLMERREDGSRDFYMKLSAQYPEAIRIYNEEAEHESQLIGMLNDRKLAYAGAIVLGMNDALVELTGTLSGIALAFDKSIAVGITGLIMGIAASLSMAGSAYLESRENTTDEISPVTYALYTGISYIVTTILLVFPFFVFDNIVEATVLMLVMALVSILSYSFYISVAKELSFRKRVAEMSFITFGVAIISFGIGYTVKHVWGIDIV